VFRRWPVPHAFLLSEGEGDLRHDCASFLLAHGVPAMVVMAVLGHSQISLTMDTYSHVAPALLAPSIHAVT
jgi:site-specific recombinase XerD